LFLTTKNSNEIIVLGVAVATATNSNPAYAEAYANDHVGGLLAEVLFPKDGGHGVGTFGKFCVIILALSIIGNNCPNIYSLTFSLQIMTHHAQRIPRFLWTFVGTCIYIAIAIPGYSHFESVLENFMLVIGYWLAIYEAIAIPEHFIFRKGFGGYAMEHYDQPHCLPPSIAALGAFLFGVLGAAMGMAQYWYIGKTFLTTSGCDKAANTIFRPDWQAHWNRIWRRSRIRAFICFRLCDIYSFPISGKEAFQALMPPEESIDTSRTKCSNLDSQQAVYSY
jgi:purine-cytosine permease-like protein